MKLDEYQTTEENFTPINYEEVKSDKHFHHSLKGCKTEMKVKIEKGAGDKHYSWSINKYCHTHGVLCSKTGWELGWYGGTETVKNERTQINWDKCKCGRKFINSTELQLGLCPKCFQREATDEQSFDLVCWRREHANELKKRNKIRREKELADKTHQRRLWLDEQFKKKQELKNLLK